MYIFSIILGSNFAFGLKAGITFGLAFGVGYIIGFFRLPLYLASGLSTLKAFSASCNKPQNVFDYLHLSSLYWDEYVYLPLPYLKDILLLAYDELAEKALQEITFIAVERPQQLRAAQAAMQEIVVRYLEQCGNLEQISSMAEHLATLLPPETKLTDPRWAIPIARLSDASRDAMQAISPIGLQGRRKALDAIQDNLRKVHPNVAFGDQHLNTRLTQVVARWQEVAQMEQKRLSRASQDVGNLDNPYKPGQYLSLKDSLFVGRRDLAITLEGALSLDSRRPTFLLNGERRIGKTSALKQLPYLLGSGYISVFLTSNNQGFMPAHQLFWERLPTRFNAK